jgi:Holliday junction resolvase RusA-like endonuclease
VSLRFFVPGRPQTAGSKTAVPMGSRMGVIEAGSKESRARKRTWRGDLRDAASKALDSYPTGAKHRGLFDSALDLTVVIVRARPAAHMRTGRHAGTVKDWAVAEQPVTRPDATKILRAAEDALQGVLFADDSQIVEQRVFKVYGDQCGMLTTTEGLYVTVEEARGYRGPMLDWIGRRPQGSVAA